VLCIIGYNTIDEAVQIANDTPYGLAGVFMLLFVLIRGDLQEAL
jgi:acyl-CoA reductase-like NAD-dependent aldehyde dehydrogenase